LGTRPGKPLPESNRENRKSRETFQPQKSLPRPSRSQTTAPKKRQRRDNHSAEVFIGRLFSAGIARLRLNVFSKNLRSM